MILKAKIDGDMPCLTAELVRNASTTIPSELILLDGQISSWSIRITNLGNAPASNVALKTNLPWVNIVNHDSSHSGISAEEREAQATSRCIGPTGTMMRLPLDDKNLREPGAIHPGETVDIPIQLRTSGSSKQEFYMLYRYELWDPDSDSGCHRWLKKMYEVPVSFPRHTAVFFKIVSSCRGLNFPTFNCRSTRPSH